MLQQTHDSHSSRAPKQACFRAQFKLFGSSKIAQATEKAPNFHILVSSIYAEAKTPYVTSGYILQSRLGATSLHPLSPNARPTPTAYVESHEPINYSGPMLRSMLHKFRAHLGARAAPWVDRKAHPAVNKHFEVTVVFEGVPIGLASNSMGGLLILTVLGHHLGSFRAPMLGFQA